MADLNCDCNESYTCEVHQALIDGKLAAEKVEKLEHAVRVLIRVVGANHGRNIEPDDWLEFCRLEREYR